VKRLLRAVFVVLSASFCVAQIAPFVPCKPGTTSTVGHADRITVKRVSFTEGERVIGATVLIPDSEGPVPGILFSHSAIHGPQNSVDLTRFALALARAGASSIILDGTIEWLAPNDDSWRSPHQMACAGQWLLLNVKLDRERLAVAGTHGKWGGGDTPICLPGERPCFDGHTWINFGQASSAESHNTDFMLTPEGRLKMARFAQKLLHLGELKPEWFDEPTKPRDSTAMSR
jgi:hypothetical protein